MRLIPKALGAYPIMLVFLVATAVPTTDEELSQMADLVVELRVEHLDIPTKLPNGAALSCFDGVVTRWMKGTSQNVIIICPNNVSEMTPPAPKLGGHYRMYLLRSPFGVYETFSYAGSKRLGG